MLIDLLGPLRVRDGAGAEVPVAGARLRRLLAELALKAGRPVSTALLEDVLWAGEPPAGAGALQSLVSRLRRVLGSPGAVAAGPAGYQLALDPEAVDATRFERGCARGRELLRAGDVEAGAAALGAARALWRGPLDELAGSPAASRLEALRRDALADRVEADLRRGRTDGLPAELAELLREDPLQERFAALRVRALHAAGRSWKRLRSPSAPMAGSVVGGCEEVRGAGWRGAGTPPARVGTPCRRPSADPVHPRRRPLGAAAPTWLPPVGRRRASVIVASRRTGEEG